MSTGDPAAAGTAAAGPAATGAAAAATTPAPPPWWRSAVFYQIYPRSFCDTNGDGVGDLEGVRRHLDHVQELGVDAIWLSPVFRSPMADFGYDVSDHCDVDPVFGTLDELDRLLDDVHHRGMRLVLDWVPNHTSIEHPWFVDSRSSRSSSKRDWYIWRDGVDGGPPNSWLAAFGGRAWTHDERSGQWYLHLFLPEQPDLDWRNPEVARAMEATLRFWLDRGVDGVRLDAVHCVAKNPTLADDRRDLQGLPRASFNDHADIHPVLRRLRSLADGYGRDRVLVGEVFLPEPRLVAPYYGHGDELHLAFNFAPMLAPWDAATWRLQIEIAGAEFDAVKGWPTWVLSNHDRPRHRTRYGGSEERARAAAVLLCTLRGTPFLYAGEELGLEDAVVEPDRAVDPGGRDPARAPLPWDATPSHGWAGEEPWLPWPPEPEHRNVASLAADTTSILHLYRRLLAARRRSRALHAGAMRLIDAPDPVVAYERRVGPDRRVVLVSFTEASLDVPLPGRGGWVVEVAADGSGEGSPFTGRLGPDGAVVLRPA